MYFRNNCSYDIGGSFLDPLDKIRICRICNEEVLKSRLYEHITSKEHINNENYFIRKCMTFCMWCNMEINNDEWSTHLNSSWHLGNGARYCDVCQMKYISSFTCEVNDYLKHTHLESSFHKKHQEGLVF